MDYSASLHYLESLGGELRPRAKYDLNQVRALLAALGSPERRFPALHIAGTNGKGSTAAYCERGLRAAGYRTGLFTSPHLERVNERIQVTGRPIPDHEFARHCTTVVEAGQSLVEQGVLPQLPSYFETLTGLGFLYFAAQKIEIGVIEVGLGGRLDATNTVLPIVSVITPVGLDHEQYLGPTIEAIAAEKAGILRPGVPCILAQQTETAAKVIRQKALELGTPSQEIVRPLASPAGGGRYQVTLQWKGEPITVVPALRGRHQALNAAVAAAALEELTRQGLAISPEALLTGMTEAEWPGRLECWQWPVSVADATRVDVASKAAPVISSRTFWLDGAHNPAAAQTLADFLAEAAMPPPGLIFGCMRDKSAAEIISILAPRISSLILTTPQNPRAATPDQLWAFARPLGLDVQSAPDFPDAMRRAAATPAGLPWLVSGSLFLVGEARSWLATQGGRRV